MLVLDGTSIATELRNICLSKAPEEAVGLLTADGRVILLPNYASDPRSNFEVRRKDILSAVRMHEVDDLEELTLWHSHPNGGVGPSRIDMQQKIPFLQHLVVTLEAADVTFTWY